MTHPVRSVRITLLLVAALLVACEEGDPTGPVSPSATITAPTGGLTVPEGATITLEGSATDPQDGAVPDASLAWRSSIDGALGTGTSVDVVAPTVGVHTVTLTATDLDGNAGTATISISVAALPFIEGTPGNPEIGVVVSSITNSLRLFRLGDPAEFRDVALGASSAVTATGVSVRGATAVVPLGNAASVAVIDLPTQRIASYWLFASGNATGSAFVDDVTVVAANQETDELGRFTIGATGGTITDVVAIAPFPSDVIAVSSTRVLVVSSNLDDAYAPIGEGVVTAVDPTTMTVIDTVHTGGQNPQFGALGPDGLLYVPNTGDYVGETTVAVIDAETMTRVDLLPGFPAGAGAVHVDDDGLLYASGFFFGTVVWDTSAEAFVRDGSNPVCAPLAGGGCRGAFGTRSAADGSLYQTFFGSPSQGLAPWIFRYEAGTFVLSDSIASELGPVEVEIHTFGSN
jgi:hypothetical protein